MYTILVGEDHSLVTTNKERIMQRSKLINTLCFYIRKELNGLDIANCTVVMEYWLPVSHKYDSIILSPTSSDMVEHLQYLLPLDTDLTAEAGDLQVQLSFIFVDLDESGNNVQQVKKTNVESIPIIPIAAWSDWSPDSRLTALDQRIIKADAQLKALEEMNKAAIENMVDNITYDEESNKLQLMADDKVIGDAVTIKSCDEDLEQGLPVVEFGGEIPDIPEEEKDYIEF